MVTKTFFANATTLGWTAGSALTIPDVVDGEVAVINIDTGLAVGSIAANAGLDPNTRLVIVQGTPAGKPNIISKIFKYSDIVYRSGKISDAAAVAQVSTVTVTAVDATKDFTLKVVDLTEGYEPFPRKSYTIQGATDLASVNAAAAALRTAINADATSFVTASGSNAEVILTHKVAGNSFYTASDNAGGGTKITIAATTAPNIGVGTKAQLAEMEQANHYTRGRATTNYFPQEFDVYATAAAYNQFILHVKNDIPGNVLREAQAQQIVVAVNGANADEANIDDRYVKLFVDNNKAITP
jgi:hypothetical protein